MSEQVVDDRVRERRLRLLRAHYWRGESYADIAEEFGVSENAINLDWQRRGLWLPELLSMDDMRVLLADVLGRWEAYLGYCADMVRRFDDVKHEANSAMKNYGEALTKYTGVLQSLGSLPKVASEQTVTVKKEEAVEVKGDESELDYVRKAASYLNKAEGCKKRSENLH